MKLNINRKLSYDRDEPQEIFSEQCTTDLIYKEKALLTHTLKHEKNGKLLLFFGRLFKIHVIQSTEPMEVIPKA